MFKIFNHQTITRSGGYLVITVTLSLIILLQSPSTQVYAKQKNGKFASILQEYHSTIKCVLNIAEETIPELDDYIACCGFWTISDWLEQKVEEECEAENVQQVRHIKGLVEPQLRQHCAAYKRGSVTCRMMIIMPMILIVLLLLIILSFCICAHVSLFKWIQVRRKYRRVANLQLMNDNEFITNDKLKNGEKNSKRMLNDYEMRLN